MSALAGLLQRPMTTTAEVRVEEGKAMKFKRCEAGNPAI